ncbi:unnamed protein product [Linum trigynum]|uniref:Pentatricopeptide repeat-containing protein n=1 Tax=Linum trigynum TaxID=586398 RepID=A0AAV2FMA9_9ROSI
MGFCQKVDFEKCDDLWKEMAYWNIHPNIVMRSSRVSGVAVDMYFFRNSILLCEGIGRSAHSTVVAVCGPPSPSYGSSSIYPVLVAQCALTLHPKRWWLHLAEEFLGSSALPEQLLPFASGRQIVAPLVHLLWWSSPEEGR